MKCIGMLHMDLFASDGPDDTVGAGPVAGPEWTPPPARAPHTGRFDLDDWDEDPAPPSRNRRWLLGAAVVPWVVVVAIMATGRQDARAPDPDAPTVVAPDPQDPTATAADSPTSAVPAPGPSSAVPHTVTAVGSTAGPEGQGAAEGLALVAARSWLSSRPAGAPVDGLVPAPGAADRYVEHLAVESVDHPARGALVVTVRAIVLPVEGDAYGAARTVRLAVPVVLDTGTPRLGGAPWWLPATDPVLDPPETAPVDDPDLMLAAVDAVHAVGYRDVELTGLSRTAGWAWVAEVRAVGPGEDASRDHALWLRSDVGRLVVAGTRAPTPATRPPSADEPSPQPTDEPTEVPS